MQHVAAQSGVQDRVEGALIGLSVGDPFGGPTELALHLAHSLIDWRALDTEDVGHRYLTRWRQGAFDTGPVTARVLSAVDAGHGFLESALEVHDDLLGLTAGCNPAHRCAPLAMAAFIEDRALPLTVRREAGITHRHRLAGESAAFVAQLARRLIRGTEWNPALAAAIRDAAPELRSRLKSLSWDGLHRGGYGPDAVTSAVFFTDAAGSFRESLELARAFEPDIAPVLVGVLAGARWGRSAIPSHLPRHHADRVSLAASLLSRDWH